ncbi:possible head fiber [Salinivibrio phage CW02]|uniref:Possible head fiber n=1 Tax=Salinivibrio phage CW02 TaxID=1161935 RepID=H9D1H0_9CAUD|nr:possible head fiber [Salinivibrio phage CW02]AFE86212.1 possible head fiber [Salinivibrio phage CW02]
MAEVQHNNIPDNQRHPPKGASTATAGQVMVATGADGVEFRLLVLDDLPGISLSDLTDSPFSLSDFNGWPISLDDLSDFSKMPAQSDSTATDVAGLVSDFNALLSKLRNAGLMGV